MLDCSMKSAVLVTCKRLYHDISASLQRTSVCDPHFLHFAALYKYYGMFILFVRMFIVSVFSYDGSHIGILPFNIIRWNSVTLTFC